MTQRIHETNKPVQEQRTQLASHRNRRCGPRWRVARRAKIFLGGAEVAVACTIDNISERGARICVSDVEELPNDFILSETSRRVVRRAEIVWRMETKLGVRFLPLKPQTATQGVV